MTTTLDLTRLGGHHPDYSSSENILLLAVTLSSASSLVCFALQLHCQLQPPQASESQCQVPKPKFVDLLGNVNCP